MQVLPFPMSYLLLIVVWDSHVNRMQFFEKYARDRGFNPLLPSDWYAQSSSLFAATKVNLFNTLHTNISQHLQHSTQHFTQQPRQHSSQHQHCTGSAGGVVIL